MSIELSIAVMAAILMIVSSEINAQPISDCFIFKSTNTMNLSTKA